MSNILLLPISRHLLYPGSGMQIYLNHPSLSSKKLFYDFSRIVKITGINPKASCGDQAIRFAGLFNLPIPRRFAFGIGVSLIVHIARSNYDLRRQEATTG
jgi:hypothetical protein